MTTKKRRFPLFFTFFTLAYLAFEILFRSEFLEVSTNVGLSDPLAITTLEIFGRFLASVGFAIFAVSNIRINVKTSKWGNIAAKLIGYPLLCLASFFGFFNFQEMVFDHLARDFSPTEKRELLTLNLLRDALYTGKINHDNEHPYQYENRSEASSKLYLSLYPFLSMDDDDLLDKIDNETVRINLLINNLNNKWNTEYHVDSMLAVESYSLSEIWRGFKVFDNTYFSNKQPSSDEVYKLYSYIKSRYQHNFEMAEMRKVKDGPLKSQIFHEEVMPESEFNRHISGAFLAAMEVITEGKHLKKPETLKSSRMSYLVNHLFDDKLGWKYNHYQSQMNAFETGDFGSYIAIDKFGLAHYYSDFLNSFPINENNCTFTKGEQNSLTINGITTNKNFLKNINFAFVGRNIFPDDYDVRGRNNLTCNIPYDNYLQTKKILKTKLTKHNPVYYMPSYHIRNLSPQRINSNPYLRKIAHTTLEKGVEKGTGEYLIESFNYNFDKYYLFLDSLNYSSPEAFKESIFGFYKEQYITKYLEKAKEHGLDLDFLRSQKNTRLSYEEFLELPLFKKEIKRKLSFLTDDKGNVINYYNFFKNKASVSKRQRELFKDHIREREYDIYSRVFKNPETLEEGGQYYELGNNIAKSFIAPPLVLSISGIMIILSLANIIIKLIAYFIEDSRKVMIFRLTFIMLLILIPIFTPNSFSLSQEIISDKEKSPFKYNLLIWLQNSETVIEYGKINDDKFRKFYEEVKAATLLVFIDNKHDRELLKMKKQILENSSNKKDEENNKVKITIKSVKNTNKEEEDGDKGTATIRNL